MRWFFFWFPFFSLHSSGGFTHFAAIAVSVPEYTAGTAIVAPFSAVAAFFPIYAIYAIAAVSTTTDFFSAVAFISNYTYNPFIAAPFSLSLGAVAFISTSRPCSAVITLTFIAATRSYSAGISSTV